MNIVFHLISVIQNSYLLIGVTMAIFFALKSVAGFIKYKIKSK